MYTFSVDQGNLILLYFNSLFFNWLFLLLSKIPLCYLYARANRRHGDELEEACFGAILPVIDRFASNW